MVRVGPLSFKAAIYIFFVSVFAGCGDASRTDDGDASAEVGGTDDGAVCSAPDGVPYCPLGWVAVGSACMPDDCDAAAWTAGTCATSNVTVHMTPADTSQPNFDDYCAVDESIFTVYLGRDIDPTFCLDVPDIDGLKGFYFTHDGGATWTKSNDYDSGIVWGTSTKPLRMLRSRLYPDVAVIPSGLVLISFDGGASMGFLQPRGHSVDGAISPDGTTLFILGSDLEGSTTQVSSNSLPWGEPQKAVSLEGSRYMGAVWSVRALSASEVLVTGRFDKTDDDGFRAVARVNLDTDDVTFTGPEFAGEATEAEFSIGEPGDPLFLTVNVDTVGYVNYRYDSSSDNWLKLDFDLGAGYLYVLDGRGKHLVHVGKDLKLQGAKRSLDGGKTWDSKDKWSDETARVYAGVVNGDRFCDTAGSSCEYWTYGIDPDGSNVVAPSFMWYRSDGGCNYLPAMGNFPLVGAADGIEALPLAPASVLALGQGRALVLVADFQPRLWL